MPVDIEKILKESIESANQASKTSISGIRQKEKNAMRFAASTKKIKPDNVLRDIKKKVESIVNKTDSASQVRQEQQQKAQQAVTKHKQKIKDFSNFNRSGQKSKIGNINSEPSFSEAQKKQARDLYRQKMQERLPNNFLGRTMRDNIDKINDRLDKKVAKVGLKDGKQFDGLSKSKSLEDKKNKKEFESRRKDSRPKKERVDSGAISQLSEKIADDAFRTGSAELLKQCWINAIDSFGLTLLYVFLHGSLKYIITIPYISDNLCRYGEEWSDGVTGGAGKVSKATGTVAKADNKAGKITKLVVDKGSNKKGGVSQDPISKGEKALTKLAETIEIIIVVCLAFAIVFIILLIVAMIVYIINLTLDLFTFGIG